MDLVISRATAGDAPDLGIVGPAAYAAAYHDDWDDAVGFFHHVKTFGPKAMAATLEREDARVWIARQEGAGVGFLTMFVGSLEPISQRPNGARSPRIYLLPVRGAAASARSCWKRPKRKRNPRAANMYGSM